ncbi:RNA 2',3'-cyclic phosphodiesterase [Megalodesulfovibrio paquesii]
MRCFIGFTLPGAWQEQFDTLENDWTPRFSSRLTWTKPEQRHLTLRFLGEISAEQVPALATALPAVLAAAAVDGRPATLEMQLAGGGYFPNIQTPRVGWVGMGLGRDALTNCAARLEDFVVSLGIARELRPYSPHVTLFRVRDAEPCRNDPWRAFAEHLAGVDWPVATLERLVLWESLLGPGAVRHVPLANAQAAAPRSP